MEEKILYPQAAMIFDIQRFAESITLDASDDEKKSTTVGNLTYSVTNGTATLTINNTTVTIASGTVDISGTTKSYTFNVSNGATTTINGVDFLSNGGTAIAFGKNDSTVTLTGAFTIGDGEQTFNLSINNVTYSGAGQISITTNAITLSGEVTAKNNLTGKTYSLTDNDELNATFSLKSNDLTKIGGITYSAANAVELNVVEDKITLVSGTVTVGTGSESLSGKKFFVTSAKATFKPLNDVKINDVTYTAKTNGCTIEVDGGNVTLTGKFSITLAAGESANFNDVKFTASKAVTFTYDSTTNEVTFASGSLAMEVNGDLKVNGVTYQDANGTMDFEDASIVTLAGDFTVEAEEGHSLSSTTFSTTSGDSTFNASSGDTVKLNGATFTAGNAGLTLEYETNDDSVTIDGNDAQVTGTGHFYLNNDVTINGTEFSSTAQYAELNFTATDTVELSSSFTIGNENQSLNLTVDGITYSGTGQIEVADSDITISGSSITVGTDNESLSGKNYTTENCAVEFNVSAGDTVTINQDEYIADEGGGSVEVATGGNVTVSNSSVTFSEESGSKNLTIAKGKTLTVGDFKYTASSDADASIIVDDKDITVTAGTVSIEAGNVTGYTFTTSGTAKISEISKASGTFTIDDTHKFEVKSGSVTYGFEDNEINSISTAKGASIDITDGTITQSSVIVSNEKPLTKYTKGWYDSPPYDYYLIKDNKVYGVTDGDEPSSETVTTAVYNELFTFENSTANLKSTSDKILKIEGSYTAISQGNTYTISSDGAATFSKTTDDGIDSIEKGIVTAENGKALDLTLGNNSVLNVGTRFSYTETDTDKTSATIEVDANGGVTVSDGTINKTINVGNFTYKNGTYTVDNDKPVFEVGDTKTDGEYLISGGGTSDVAVGSSVTIDDTDITVSATSKYLAQGDNDGGYTAFKGKGTYDVEGGNFIAETNKEYTISGNATYELTATGVKTGGITTELKSATGTRAFVSGTDSENKPYLGDTYTVTDGVYTVEVTAGTRGTKDLTSGNATYNISSGENFHYNLDNSTREYAATENVSIKISFGDDISITNKSGAGTRNADGSTDKTTYNNDTYTLDSTAKIKLTLSNGQENFDEGTAQYSANAGTSFHYDDKEYTAKDNATLTLTKDNGVTSTALTAGNGTREQSAPNFEYDNKIYTDTATSGNVTYILKTNKTAEELYYAQGTRDYADGNVTFNEDSYAITGTYSFTLNNGSTSESLTAAGTYSAGDGQTFHFDNKTYQGFEGGATLTINYDNQTPSLDSAVGKGTRAAYGNETTAYDNNTYVVNKDSIIKVDITDRDTSEENFYDGTATQTYTSGSGVFHFKNQDYTAQGDATLTLTKENGTVNAPTLTGNGTRTGEATTFTTTGLTDTFTATGNIVYQISDSDAEKVYSAEGTRSLASTDDFKTTYDSDEYTATAGTYSISVVDGAGTQTLSSGSATYTTDNGVFHFKDKTYTAASETTLTISLENNAAKELTAASGVGTRTATTADSNITYTYDSDTYSTNFGSIIKAVVSNKDTVEETFLKGTATYTTDDGTFHYDNKAYNAVSNTTITLTYDGTKHSKTFSANSAGTRTDSVATFKYSGNTYTFQRTSDNINYLATGGGATLTENVYNATGTRTDVTDETHVGDWGNSYQLANGLRTVTVTNGEVTDVLTSATASNTYTGSNNQIFNYDGAAYTATNYNATLNLSITNDTPEESFVLGSGKNGDGYIIKTQADIGAVTYSSNNNIVKVNTDNDAITAIDGTITGSFENNEVATIGNINYTAKAASTLQVNSMTDVKVTQGSFEATGNFSTARKINDSRTLEIADDTDVKISFSTGDVTKIENLSDGANVKNAAGATEVITDSEGTFKFSQQTITIQNDSDATVKFTLDSTGIVTGISNLSRSDSGAYVTVNVIETDTTTYSMDVRTPGENELQRNADGTWTEPDFSVDSYIVTYDGTFKVQAVVSGSVITLTTTDYTVSNGTTLTITGNDENKKPVVVTNESDSDITVDGTSGIGNTGTNAIQIDADGNFKIGTYDGDGNFTAGGEGSTSGDFKVSGEGSEFKLTVDSNSGEVTMTVSTTNANQPVSIKAPKNSNLFVEGKGTFKINNNSMFAVTPTQKEGQPAPIIEVLFDDDGYVDGFNITGSCKIDDYGFFEDDEESSGLLAQSGDIVATYLNKLLNGTRIIVTGDDDGAVTWVTSDNTLTGVENVSLDATIKITQKPNDFTAFSVNGEALATVTQGEKINYKYSGSLTKKWVCGLADAQTNANYKAEINANDEIILYVGTTQIKNVNDYKAAFGSSYVPKNNNVEEDDGDLPKYGSSITLNNKVTELKISPPGSKSYTINNKTITLTGETTIKPVTDNNFSGDVTVELKNGVSAIYNNMTFSGNNADTNITIPASGAISLSADTKISGNPSDKSLTSNGHKIIFENITSGSNITIDNNALTVTGDTSFNVEGNVISDIGQDAQISGAFLNSASIVTNSVGTFKVGNKSYVISNDSKVTIGTNSSGEVNAIDDLGGEVTGDFTNEIAVNTKAVQVTGDTDIGVVGDISKVTKIFNVTGGENTNVVNAGGAETISTDGNGGKFQILSKTYSLSSGTADFIASNGAVTGIKNVGSGVTIKPSQSESNFEIGNDKLTFNQTDLLFEMGAGTVAGAQITSSDTELSGLSKGATVNVKTENAVKINTADVQINDSDYYVYVKDSTGYSTITSVEAGSTITKAAEGAIIIPDAAGTFTFGSGNSKHQFNTDSKPTFTMGSSNKVSAISGVSGNVALYQDETGLKVLNDTIDVAGASSNDAVTLVTGNGSVNQVKNLKGDVNGLIAGALVNVKTANAINFNSTSNNLQISETSTDYTVRATSDGYDLITGLDSGAVVTTAKNASLVATMSANNQGNYSGTYTFGGNQFDIEGDEEVTFVTGGSTNVTNIADVSYATISVYDTLTGLKINGKAINVEGTSTAPVKVKVGGNGDILGFEGLNSSGSYSLPAGATINVDTNDNVKINGKDFQVNGAVHNATVRATENGYDLVTGLVDGAVITTAEKDAIIIPNAGGTFTFGGHQFKTDSQPTFTMGEENLVSAISGVSGEVALYQDETGLKVLNDTITVKGATSDDAVTLVTGNGSVQQVKNLKGDIKGLSAGASVEVATNSNIKLNDDSKTLQISNAATNKVTVHTTADGYDSVVGLKGGASVSVAAADVTLTTAENGTFGFKINGAYITDGDDTISFVTGENSSVKSIYDFNGTISGDFSEAVTINNKTVNVTSDTAISVVGAGSTEGISKITNLSNGAVVNNAGGATTISAAEVGEFSFKTGDTTHKFSLSGTADFLSAQYTDYNPSITGIKNLTSGTVVAYQDEKGLTVGNSIVTISGAAGDDYPVSLGITNSTISGVDNLKGEISGLSGGATVNTADGDVTINNSRLNITGTNTAATVYARDYNDGYGYGTIKGFEDGVTFAEAKNTSLVTKAFGDYTFGSGTTSHKFTTANDTEVTIVTDANSKVTAIGGLESASLTIYQDEEDFVINGKTIKIKDVPTIGTDDEKKVAVSVDAYGNIVGVGNLKGAISNLPTNVSVSIAYSEVTINNSKLKISDGAATVYAKEGNGYGTITGVNSGATIVEAKNSSIIATAAASGQGTYTFGNDTTHKFVMGGASAATVTLATDFDGNVTAVGGMDNNESLAVYQKESGLWIDGKQLQIDNVPSGEAVTLKSNGSKISEVGNLKGLINNLSTNVSVQVADAEVTINGETFKIDEGSGAADATVVTGINGSNTITGVTSGVNISEAKNSSIVATVANDNTQGIYQFGTNHKFAVDGDSDVTLATDINSKVTAIGGLKNATLTFYQSEEDFVINGKTIKIKDVPNNDNVAVSVDAYGNIVGVGNLKGSMYNLPSNVTVNVMDSDVTINGAALKIAEETTNFTVRTTANGYDTITGIENGATIDTAPNVSIVATVSSDNTQGIYQFGTNHKFAVDGDSDVTIATDHNSKATAIGGFIGTLTSPEEYNVINGASIYSSNTDVSIVAASTVSVDNIFGTVQGANISVPAGVTVQANVKSDEVSSNTSFTINGTAYALLGDGDKIEIKDRTITGLDADARLTITGAVGSFNVNDTELNITTTQNIVIGDGTKARLYDPNDIDFGANTPVEDIVKQVGITADETITVGSSARNETNVSGNNQVVLVTESGKTVSLAGNQDLLIVEKGATNTNVYANGESDTIIVSATNGTTVTGNSDTHVMPTSNVTMTYDGYNHSLNAGLQITNADVVAAVKDNVLKFTDTNITLPNNAVVAMNYDTNAKGIVNFYNIQGEMQKVGYTYSDNNTIDYRNLNGDIVLKGNWTTGGVASTLYGGNGNDTAFGSVGDFFNLGNGSNYVEISSTRAANSHATIESNATNGDTTVKGFKANDFTSGDVIKIATSEDRTGVTYSGSNLIFTDKNYNTTLSIADMTAYEESGSVGYVNVLMQDINSTEEAVKTSIAKRGMVINVAEEVANISKSYVGDNSGVDFSNLDSDDGTSPTTVNINLGDGKGKIGSTPVELRGITSLKGGVGKHTLFGNGSVDNTIAAGKGEAKIWGGSGTSNDYLIGNTSTDKSASTFVYRMDGKDTIDSFQFYTVDGAANNRADILSLGNTANDIALASVSGKNVILRFKDSASNITIKDACGKVFQANVLSNGDFATIEAQVSSDTLVYDGTTDWFYATSDNVSVNVAEGISNKTISFEDSNFNGDLAVLDASKGTSDLILVGNGRNNTIIAGSDGSTILGNSLKSAITNDSLVGGEGADVFYYSTYGGNDTISNFDSGDIVYLNGLTLDLAKANINTTLSSDNELVMSSGYKLTIQHSGVTATKFKISDTEYNSWADLKTSLTTSSNADIAEDWKEVHRHDELLDGEVTFWTGNDISTEDDNYLTDEILTGDIQFSISSADTLYTFSDK